MAEGLGAEKPSGTLAVLGNILGFFTGSQQGGQDLFDKVEFVIILQK